MKLFKRYPKPCLFNIYTHFSALETFGAPVLRKLILIKCLTCAEITSWMHTKK